VKQERVPSGSRHVEQIELKRQIDGNRIQTGGHGRQRDLATRPTNLLPGRIGHQDFDSMRAAGLFSSEENARRERDTRQREWNRRDLQIVEDADERRTAVVPENDLVAESDVLDVHVKSELKDEASESTTE
jgi:hypothetical protein